jgi:hypothetical protein
MPQGVCRFGISASVLLVHRAVGQRIVEACTIAALAGR